MLDESIVISNMVSRINNQYVEPLHKKVIKAKQTEIFILLDEIKGKTKSGNYFHYLPKKRQIIIYNLPKKYEKCMKIYFIHGGRNIDKSYSICKNMHTYYNKSSIYEINENNHIKNIVCITSYDYNNSTMNLLNSDIAQKILNYTKGVKIKIGKNVNLCLKPSL